jgi:hypothetical protein
VINKTSLLISLHDLNCKLYKEKAIIDKNVKCSIDILRSHSCPIFKARGVIETSISLPITSSDLEAYSHFELGFDEPIEGISKILIVITEVNWKNKKRARFESLSYKSSI